MPLHAPAGAVPTLRIVVGVGFGVAGSGVVTLGNEEGGVPAVGDGESPATLHPAARPPIASPTARFLSRPGRRARPRPPGAIDFMARHSPSSLSIVTGVVSFAIGDILQTHGGRVR